MGAKRVAAPNYTQAPNEFFDEIMLEITSTAELKVTLAIIRQTFGYHKDEDTLSLSRLEELTGLSRKSVAEGIKLALARGYIGRRKDGNTYCYGLRVASEESTPSASEESTPTKERGKESKELTNVRSSGKGRSEELIQPLDQYHTNQIYNAMKERGYRWTGDEYGYHLGRVKDMLAKDKPTNEELDGLPSFFADYYEDWNPKADAVSALREMRRSQRREQKPLQGHSQHEAPHPHSDAAQTAREKPRAVTWYLACYNEDESVLSEWIGDGLSHSEIVARLEGRAA